MKKSISIILALSIILTFFGCTKDDPATPTETSATKHSHNYTQTQVKAPSCSIEGEMKFSCECGDSYTEKIKTTDHTFADATCTVAKTCTVCGTTEGDPVAHNYSEATCQAPKTCIDCGHTDGDIADHMYSGKFCSICGKKDPNYHSYDTGYWTCISANQGMQLQFLGDNWSASIYRDVISYDDYVALNNPNLGDDEEDPQAWYTVFEVGEDKYAYCWPMVAHQYGEYSIKGNTITISNDYFRIVIERTAGNQFIIKSINKTYSESEVEFLKTGDIFVWCPPLFE